MRFKPRGPPVTADDVWPIVQFYLDDQAMWTVRRVIRKRGFTEPFRGNLLVVRQVIRDEVHELTPVSCQRLSCKATPQVFTGGAVVHACQRPHVQGMALHGAWVTLRVPLAPVETRSHA